MCPVIDSWFAFFNHNNYSEYIKTFLFYPFWDRQIGFDWVCFSPPSKREILYNPLSYKTLRQFSPTANWLCFFKLYFQPPENLGAN